MSRRTAFAALDALLLVLLLLTVARGVRAAGAVADDRDAARAYGAGTRRNLGLDGVVARRVDGGGPVDLGAMRSGLVLLFDPACVPSAANMWNWVDLVRALGPDGPPVVALTLDTVGDPAGYWEGLREEVTVAVADTATLRDRLRIGSTPATLLVENGAVRWQYVGPLDTVATAGILRRLRAPREEGAR